MGTDATDKARERADELGVDIDAIEGSGQDGRVTVGDVEAAAKGSEAGSSEAGSPDADAPMEPTADNAEMPTAAAPPETAEYMINPDTGLRGYDWGDGFGVVEGERPMLTQEQYDKYKTEKHNGERILVKR